MAKTKQCLSSHQLSSLATKKPRRTKTKKKKKKKARVSGNISNMNISNAVFPHEIMSDILSRLPAKSVMQFTCVSKSWYDLIRHPVFINMHSARPSAPQKLLIDDFDSLYTLDYQHSNKARRIKTRKDIARYKIWGSSNGVIFTEQFHRYEQTPLFFFWNPLTGKHRKVPHMYKRKTSDNTTGITYGFSYNPHLNDYVVLNITGLTSLSSMVHLYSVRRNAWRALPDIPCTVPKHTSSSGVSLHGAFHWIVNSCDADGTSSLIAYNIQEEKYREIPLPNLVEPDIYTPVYEFKEKLCIVHLSCIWVMNEYGVRGSWTRLLNIEQFLGLDMGFCLKFTNCKLIAAVRTDGDESILYDPAKNMQWKIQKVLNVSEVYCYSESIVQLNNMI